MKLLKWLLMVMLSGALLAVGGLMLPAASHMARSTTIERPSAEVFAMLDSFRRFNEWSPWFEMDPEATYTHAGPASGVGARMAWVGNQSVGTGSQEILESVPNQRIRVALDFGGSRGMATYVLVQTGQRTELTWAFDSEHGYNPVNRFFGAFLLERMVGKDYETGLARLKALMESGER